MQNHRLIKYLDILSYLLVVLTILVIPLVFSKSLPNLFVLPKQYWFIGLMLISIFVFALKIVVSRKFYYRKSAFDIPIAIFLLVALLSSLFSKNLYNSFLGRNESFLINFVFLADIQNQNLSQKYLLFNFIKLLLFFKNHYHKKTLFQNYDLFKPLN